MKKELTTMLLSMFAAAVMAQETNGDNRLANIDWQEDSVEITTIKDIIRTQQAVTSRSATSAHFAKVWSKRGYFHAAYHTKSTLAPEEAIMTGLDATEYNGGLVPTFSRKWGISIMAGKNIKLHKPIAQMVAFNLDFTGLDLSFNYYKAENGGERIYDSGKTYADEDGETCYYPHWNARKYQLSYGMNLGPSLTLAPFTHVNGANGLHFLKFNVYYHIGYRVSFMLHNPDIDEDVQETNTALYGDELEARNHIQFMIGHGLYHSIGFGMSWKRIGFGYEHTFGKYKFKSIGDDDFEGTWYDFKTTTNRVFLTYRFGK